MPIEDRNDASEVEQRIARIFAAAPRERAAAVRALFVEVLDFDADVGLSPEAVARFVDEHDASGVSLASAPKVGAALDEATIVDPACGSGAYLLGMMQELVELQTALYNVGVDPRSLYDLKLHIIQRNLYGVDNDEFAVNIAMLRMWLSLAIEYEGERPEPLPNLDFKVVRGDSLLGPDPGAGVEVQGALGRDAEQIRRLGRLKAEYMRASTGPEKERLKEAVRELEGGLKSALGDASVPEDVVDWRVRFAEVFAEGKGFDIAVANPPYVRMEQIGAAKQDLARLYPEVFAPRADYLVYFYSRAIQLLRNGGVLAFITSNKYMRAGYGEKLRGFLPAHLTISQLVDFGDLPVFTATAYPAVLVGRKGTAKDGHGLRVADLAMPVRQAVADRGLSVTTETVNQAMDGLSGFLDGHGVADYPQALLRQSGWILEPPELVRLFNRLMNQGTSLGEFVKGRIYRGVVTGLNEAFVIDQPKRDELVKADPRSKELIKPWLRGKDIGRWRADWAGLYIIFASRGVDINRYPAIEEHLEWFRIDLEKRATSHLHPWYELQQPQEGIYREFDYPKIIFNRFIKSPTFAYDASGIYHNDACYFLIPPSPSIAAIVNSRIGWWLLWHLCTVLQNGYFQVFVQFLKQLPVPALSSEIGRRLSEHVKTLALGLDAPGIESEIEDMVTEAFDLSRKEAALVGEWFERRSLGG